MKKKILLCVAIIAVLMCIFAISASAAEMTSYCSIKLTLTNGEEVTAYCLISGDQVKRDTLYKSTDTLAGTYNWEDVVIFDCRDQIAVGGTPRSFSGTVCNDHAYNVKTVYLSEYFTYFLNTTFTSGWKSLETVYLSSSLTDLKGFSGSPVKNVIIPENSKLKSISGDAFNGCNKLENIDISKCEYLETIGANAFRSCTSLTTITFPESLIKIERNGFYLSGLSGTIVVPNSVTDLKEGAFLSAKIETLIIGDGPVTIGYNFVGGRGDKYLKNVYLPAEAIISSTTTFYDCANPVNYYIVGEDCDALVARLLEQKDDGTYAKFITEDQVTESTGAGYGIIRTGYNRCEIFYDEIHDFDMEAAAESCIVVCDRCKLTVSSGGDHRYELSEEFSDGKFTSSCTVINSCSVCGEVESKIDVGTIIVCLGFSVTEGNLNENGVTIGYVVHSEAISLYESATGKSIGYGLFAALKTTLGNNDVVNTPGASSVDMGTRGAVVFQIKIFGFDTTNGDLEFAMGAYIAETKGETTQYTYVQNSTPKDDDKYSFDSFDSIKKLCEKEPTSQQ